MAWHGHEPLWFLDAPGAAPQLRDLANLSVASLVESEQPFATLVGDVPDSAFDHADSLYLRITPVEILVDVVTGSDAGLIDDELLFLIQQRAITDATELKPMTPSMLRVSGRVHLALRWEFSRVSTYVAVTGTRWIGVLCPSSVRPDLITLHRPAGGWSPRRPRQ